MIGNHLENSIIGIFNSDPTQFLSINQISKKLNKAYPHIHSKVNRLIGEGVLNKTNVGRSYLCSINLESEKALLLLAINEIEKKERFTKALEDAGKLLYEISQIRSDFRVFTIFFIGESLCFVLDHIYDQEAIKNRFRHVKRLRPRFMTKDEFIKNILSDKSYLTDPVIMYSPETYFEIVRENLAEIMMRYSEMLRRK